MDLRDQIALVLKCWDETAEPIDEMSVGSALRPICGQIERHELPIEVLAEVIAFSVQEVWDFDGSPWESMYAPVFPPTDDDPGYPSIDDISVEILTVWKRRAEESRHPVLKTRYNGLAWEFGKKLCQRDGIGLFAQRLIDSVIEISKLPNQNNPHGVFVKLKFALATGLQIKDRDRVRYVAKAIQGFEQLVGADHLAGLWGHAFELLSNRGVDLTDSQKAEIIQRMEDRLDRLLATEAHPEKWPERAARAAELLCTYYRSQDRKSDVERVSRKYIAFVMENVRDDHAFAGVIKLRMLCEFGQRFGSKDDVDAICIRQFRLGPKVRGELKTISSVHEVPNEAVRKFVSLFLRDDHRETLQRVVKYFMPYSHSIEAYLASGRRSVLIDTVTVSMLDDRGIRASNEDDAVAARTMQLIGELLSDQENMFKLRVIMANWLGEMKLTAGELLQLVVENGLFDPERQPILKRGMEAYFDSDYLVAMHLLVPQIEAAIRKIVDGANRPVLVPNEVGGFDYRTLGALLADPATKSVFGEDVCLYMRMLLTDERGPNIRSRICHGIFSADEFNAPLADRLIHLLLYLSLFRRASVGSSSS